MRELGRSLVGPVDVARPSDLGGRSPFRQHGGENIYQYVTPGAVFCEQSRASPILQRQENVVITLPHYLETRLRYETVRLLE